MSNKALYMNSQNTPHEATLGEIKNLMERSSRFISLSGLSGITAGIFAIAGVSVFCYQYSLNPFSNVKEQIKTLPPENITHALLTGMLILILSTLFAIYWTGRRSRKLNENIWGSSSKRLLINTMIPLICSIAFCLLLAWELPDLVLPLSLIFYGMTLFNAGNFTISAIRSLGVVEMLLGIVCLALPEYHIIIWTFGFGVMHIVYGLGIYLKTERQHA